MFNFDYITKKKKKKKKKKKEIKEHNPKWPEIPNHLY